MTKGNIKGAASGSHQTYSTALTSPQEFNYCTTTEVQHCVLDHFTLCEVSRPEGFYNSKEHRLCSVVLSLFWESVHRHTDREHVERNRVHISAPIGFLPKVGENAFTWHNSERSLCFCFLIFSRNSSFFLFYFLFIFFIAGLNNESHHCFNMNVKHWNCELTQIIWNRCIVRLVLGSWRSELYWSSIGVKAIC